MHYSGCMGGYTAGRWSGAGEERERTLVELWCARHKQSVGGAQDTSSQSVVRATAADSGPDEAAAMRSVDWIGALSRRGRKSGVIAPPRAKLYWQQRRSGQRDCATRPRHPTRDKPVTPCLDCPSSLRC